MEIISKMVRIFTSLHKHDMSWAGKGLKESTKVEKQLQTKFYSNICQMEIKRTVSSDHFILMRL